MCLSPNPSLLTGGRGALRQASHFSGQPGMKHGLGGRLYAQRQAKLFLDVTKAKSRVITYVVHCKQAVPHGGVAMLAPAHRGKRQRNHKNHTKNPPLCFGIVVAVAVVAVVHTFFCCCCCCTDLVFTFYAGFAAPDVAFAIAVAVTFVLNFAAADAASSKNTSTPRVSLEGVTLA